MIKTTCVTNIQDMRDKLAAFIRDNQSDLSNCEIDGYLTDALSDLDYEINRCAEMAAESESFERDYPRGSVRQKFNPVMGV